MTRTELKELTHFYLNELAVTRIKDSDADEYDLNQALFHALERYFRETRCSLVNYTLAATAGKATYSFGAFGQESADTDSLSLVAAANNTNPFALIQRLDFTGTVTGGTFVLSITATDGTVYPSAALAWNISNANLKTALDALLVTAGYATATVAITGGPAPLDTVVSFTNAFPIMTGAGGSLTGGGSLAVIREPTVAVCPSHYVTVTIFNNTGAPATGNATNATVVGTLESGATYTEVLAFTAAQLTLADQTGYARTTLSPFATVTSITPSVAQVANWQHYAGVAAEDRAKRVFDLSYLSYNESPLTRRERDFMDGWSSKWRTSDNGTPTVWLAWGDKQFRLWRPPDGTDNIYIEGWQTPDTRVLADDTQEPPIEASEQEILAMHAAIIVTIRDSANEQLVRQSALWPQVQRGWQRAYQRIHGAGDRTIIFGRGNPAIRSDWPPVSETIITI